MFWLIKCLFLRSMEPLITYKTLLSVGGWVGVYSKRKEFAPCGGKFFSFSIDPFSEGMQREWTAGFLIMYKFPILH